MGSFILFIMLGMFSGLIGIWWNNESSIKKIILSILLLLTLGYSISEHYLSLKTKKITNTWGTFNFPTNNKTKPTLFKGFIANPLILKNDWEDRWDAWPENGKINLNGTVRDSQGNIVFQMTGTDWKNFTSPEFNYDNKAIEIKDSKGNIIFQLEFNEKENKVNIYGITYNGPNQLLLMGREITETAHPFEYDKISKCINSMKPIFKYPKENHLGERVEGHPLSLSEKFENLLELLK